jgi:hypothetical protein
VEICLAEQNRAGALQSADYFGIFGGNAILEQLTRSSGADAGSVDVVLQRDRDAMEWAARATVLELSFELARLGEGCLRGHGYEGVELWIELLDSI